MAEMNAVELRQALSKAYCAVLEKKIGKRKIGELREMVQGNSDRHSRCPSERFGVDSGALMKKVWIEVTGDGPPPIVDDKTGDEVPGTDLLEDRLWTDGRSIRSHLDGAFFWNRQSNYWEEGNAFAR